RTGRITSHRANALQPLDGEASAAAPSLDSPGRADANRQQHQPTDAAAPSESTPNLPAAELNAAIEEAPPPKRWKRRRDKQKDADRRNRIKSVIAAAREKWPDPKKWPEFKPMAAELVRLKKNHDFSEGTVRQILNGTYRPMKELGITSLK